MTRPTVVTLCGSTRFKEAFIEANYRETMAGKVVLSVGWFSHADVHVYTPTEAEKAALDQLHLCKIDMSDEVLVLNVKRLYCPCCEAWGSEATPSPAVREGLHCGCPTSPVERPYVGESTRREIKYAHQHGKRVRWLNMPSEE